MKTFREYLAEGKSEKEVINEANMAYYNFASKSKEIIELADKMKIFIKELGGDTNVAKKNTMSAVTNKLMELIK